MRSKTWGWFTTAFVLVCGLGVVLAQVSQDDSVGKDGAITPAAAEPIDIGTVVPLPPNAVFRPYLVGVGEISGSAASNATGSVLYSNRLGNGIFAPGGKPGARVADDISTLASEGCILDSMRFRVSGDTLGDGTGTGGYHVDFAFYSGCPSAGGFPLFGPERAEFFDNGAFHTFNYIEGAGDGMVTVVDLLPPITKIGTWSTWYESYADFVPDAPEWVMNPYTDEAGNEFIMVDGYYQNTQTGTNYYFDEFDWVWVNQDTGELIWSWGDDPNSPQTWDEDSFSGGGEETSLHPFDTDGTSYQLTEAEIYAGFRQARDAQLQELYGSVPPQWFSNF